MNPNEPLAIRLANEVGAISYSTPPIRAVTGRSFTYAQLEKFVELVQVEFRSELATALCSDCENGVKSLNIAAHEKFKKDYPELNTLLESKP